MKRVLITGKNSYIGESFEKWVEHEEKLTIDKISVRDDSWKEIDFSKYDTVLHLAGIAHVSADPKMEEKYYKVNRDLTVEIAEHAKSQGVQQFVFMSSIIIYGDASKQRKRINEKTVPVPSNFYGNSKLQAEKVITELRDVNFQVAILRPPMIYGKGSKGNYPKLAKAAKKLPVFPDISNERSMLHIDNLCELLKQSIIHQDDGLFFPQNKEFVNTSDLVKEIAHSHGKKVKLTQLFNPLIIPLTYKVNTFNKLFGTLVYEKELSRCAHNYQIRSFSESIKITEK